MLLAYENLSAADLRGSTLADYLIAIEADFRMLDGETVIYEEPYFPVIELARALSLWVARGCEDDFAFESMSYEEPGAVVIVRQQDGWTFGSRLTPEVASSVVLWAAIQDGIRRFIAQVRADLTRLGIDPEGVLSP